MIEKISNLVIQLFKSSQICLSNHVKISSALFQFWDMKLTIFDKPTKTESLESRTVQNAGFALYQSQTKTVKSQHAKSVSAFSSTPIASALCFHYQLQRPSAQIIGSYTRSNNFAGPLQKGYRPIGQFMAFRCHKLSINTSFVHR